MKKIKWKKILDNYFDIGWDVITYLGLLAGLVYMIGLWLLVFEKLQ